MTAGLDSWEDAAQECRKLCERCRRCRYMTVSLYYADCSWYHECDLPAVKPDRDRDFRSMALEAVPKRGPAQGQG